MVQAVRRAPIAGAAALLIHDCLDVGYGPPVANEGDTAFSPATRNPRWHMEIPRGAICELRLANVRLVWAPERQPSRPSMRYQKRVSSQCRKETRIPRSKAPRTAKT